MRNTQSVFGLDCPENLNIDLGCSAFKQFNYWFVTIVVPDHYPDVSSSGLAPAAVHYGGSGDSMNQIQVLPHQYEDNYQVALYQQPDAQTAIYQNTPQVTQLGNY